ncbi:MAG: MAPEG family protein [Deltaproteobacteria bacterium]|nr:MAPEG family protein [Deltaproteobacteria bacterium]
MNDYSLVYPMFAMVLLSFVILATLFRTRLRLIRNGEVNARYFKIYQDGAEPEAAAKLARHFVNLFEAPTLFYIACLSALIVGQSTLLMNVLAWLYVGFRCAHAYIHTGSNKLNHRVIAYFSGWTILLLMWISIVIGVAASRS